MALQRRLNQRWRLEKAGPYVRLINANSGKPLGAAGGPAGSAQQQSGRGESVQWRLVKQ